VLLRVESRLLFSDIGEVVPKGFEEPVRLYECYYQSEDAAED
jgi:hypothetical protein